MKVYILNDLWDETVAGVFASLELATTHATNKLGYDIDDEDALYTITEMEVSE